MDLLIVKESFAVQGSQLVWPQGRIVESSHPVAKKYPQHFRPVAEVVFEPSAPKPARGRGRKAEATPAED